MKKYFALLLLLAACNYTEKISPQAGLIGTWKLTHQLLDPGGGSETFQSVSSTKTVTFSTDGSFHSNGSMCAMDYTALATTDGTYTTTDSTLTVNSCQAAKIHFKIKEAHLILSYSCFEGCQQKYEKVN